MSVYLKRVQLDSVEEYEENPSVYCKRVEVVEVVDENNNIWTFDQLKIADNGGSNWIGGNVYEVGETVTAKTAIYTGGKEPIEYRYIFAMRDDASSSWVAIDGGFKSTTNAKNSVTVVLPRAGQVALQSDAIDSSFPPVKVDSDTGPRTVTAPAITVSQATKISNGSTVNPQEVYGFETISVIAAVFAGGYGTLTQEYRLQKKLSGSDTWSNLTEWNASVTLSTHDVASLTAGTLVRAQSRATDAAGTVKTSSSPTPVVGITTNIGTVVITPDSAALAAGIEQEFTASVSGGSATNLMFNWTVRSGSAQLMSANNISSTALYKFDTAGSTQIQCYVASPGASNTPQSAIATIIVS